MILWKKETNLSITPRMWLQFTKLSKASKDEIILGIIYQPPENSKYLIGDEIELIERICYSVSINIIIWRGKAR